MVGAVAAVEEAGYQFENLAGTSAGAIVASLLAVGYTGNEISEELQKLDYLKFKDEDLLDKMGLMGKTLSVFMEYGVYEGTYFETWLEGLLTAKGKTKFGHIKIENPSQEKYTYKFQAIASDITDKRLLVLPIDLKDFGIDPDEFSIARAVRMSMSIPIFYEPVKLTDATGKEHYIVDGGILSNYPIWLLDDGSSNPEWPTFGFKFIEDSRQIRQTVTRQSIHSIQDYLMSIVCTALDAHDNYHISTSQGDYERTILIPIIVDIGGIQKKIGTTDFEISKDESEALFNNGAKAAKDFINNWDFDNWKNTYRKSQNVQHK